MAPRPAVPKSPSNAATAYSLALLSEYTHTLDALPIDLSRSFADLRELDAVLSSSMASIATKIHNLTQMIEQGTGQKEEKLWLLTEIAEEASRLKPGGEDKIRVACQAADHLKAHHNHLRTLTEHLPDFDPATLNRQTAYPHVAAKSFMPVALLESGRRRRPVFNGSLLTTVPDPSPAKRKRNGREEDFEVRSPRKMAIEGASRSRNSNRPKRFAFCISYHRFFLILNRCDRNERAASPTESILSVTSHKPGQASREHASTDRAASNQATSRIGNGHASTSNGNKRARTNNTRGVTPSQNEHYAHNGVYEHSASGSRRDAYNVPPSSNHPSLPLPYGTTYDLHGQPHSQSNPMPVSEWNPSLQLEGPGMPVARNHTVYAPVAAPLANVAAAIADDATEGGDADADGDDKPYCICGRGSFGQMVACDDPACQVEWVSPHVFSLPIDSCSFKYHVLCLGLEEVPDGTWYCDACKTRRAKRSGRGGKRKTGGGRANGR